MDFVNQYFDYSLRFFLVTFPIPSTGGFYYPFSSSYLHQPASHLPVWAGFYFFRRYILYSYVGSSSRTRYCNMVYAINIPNGRKPLDCATLSVAMTISARIVISFITQASGLSTGCYFNSIILLTVLSTTLANVGHGGA